MTARTINSQVAAMIFEIKVSVGDKVAEGDTLVLLESMKMEVPVHAPSAGVVLSIAVEKDAVVAEGDALVVLDT